MNNPNKVKSERLGMSFSKASHQLRKNIMFSLAKKSGMDKCYRCGKLIETINELSIEHKESWLYSDNPLNSFFNLENIAFSHNRCNSAHRNFPRVINSKSGYKGVYKANYGSRKKKWRACYNGKTIGHFDSPIVAAIEYDKEATKQLGERAMTNKKIGLL